MSQCKGCEFVRRAYRAARPWQPETIKTLLPLSKSSCDPLCGSRVDAESSPRLLKEADRTGPVIQASSCNCGNWAFGRCLPAACWLAASNTVVKHTEADFVTISGMAVGLSSLMLPDRASWISPHTKDCSLAIQVCNWALGLGWLPRAAAS